jgi:hypothetical protein
VLPAHVTDNVITMLTTPAVHSIIVMLQPKGGAWTLYVVTCRRIRESCAATVPKGVSSSWTAVLFCFWETCVLHWLFCKGSRRWFIAPQAELDAVSEMCMEHNAKWDVTHSLDEGTLYGTFRYLTVVLSSGDGLSLYWQSCCLFSVLILYRHLGTNLRTSNTYLRGGRSGARIPLRARFFTPVETGPGAHPAPCTMGAASPGLKWPGRAAEHHPI